MWKINSHFVLKNAFHAIDCKLSRPLKSLYLLESVESITTKEKNHCELTQLKSDLHIIYQITEISNDYGNTQNMSMFSKNLIDGRCLL